MNLSMPSASACPSCGAELPAAARFCPGCGAPVADPAGTTVREPIPPTEPERPPATMRRAEPRWFGVAPPHVLLVAGFAALGASIGLFASGRWPYGLIVLGVAILLLGLFVESSLHRPASETARRSARAWRDGRSRLATAWEVWRARSDAAAEGRRVQSEIALLEAEWPPAAQALGAAVHGGDEEAERAARERLRELDERRGALERRLREGLEEAGKRIRRARLAVDQTVMVAPSGPNAPYPPPDEGTPPTPAPVPEPYPPPDEGTPPTPAPDPGIPGDK